MRCWKGQLWSFASCLKDKKGKDKWLEHHNFRAVNFLETVPWPPEFIKYANKSSWFISLSITNLVLKTGNEIIVTVWKKNMWLWMVLRIKMHVTGLTSQQGKTTKILMAVELTSGKYIISRAIWLSCPGGGDSDARRKFWIRPLKETFLGVAQAFFDP